MYKTQLSAKVITLYPELFPGPLSASVTGRALQNKLWSLETIDLKKYGRGRHKKVDDKPISGGPGMILMPDVLDEAVLEANSLISGKNKLIVCMSAKGTVLKRVRQSRKANAKNKHYKSIVKSVTKKVLSETKKDEASKIADSAFSAIDRVASKGIIHKNKAANQKARISKHLNNLK